tara:strand:+ start:892 stop:1341 length:450 start_codon:yes stop_codon:yes gene_type:complete
MKLTKNQLRKLIREQLKRSLILEQQAYDLTKNQKITQALRKLTVSIPQAVTDFMSFDEDADPTPSPTSRENTYKISVDLTNKYEFPISVEAVNDKENEVLNKFVAGEIKSSLVKLDDEFSTLPKDSGSAAVELSIPWTSYEKVSSMDFD